MSTNTLRLCLIVVLALVVIVLCPFFGTISLSPAAVFGQTLTVEQRAVFFEIRLPRVCFAFLAGAALSVAGLVFQALLRNFLASPFTLGVASGAAFGSAIFFNLGLSFTIFGLSGASLFGMAGALLTILPLYILSRGLGVGASTEILLAGVVLGLFFSSLVVFLQCLSDFSGVMQITRWLMGGFEVVGYSSVLSLLPFAITGLGLALYFRFELNLFSLGQELAKSRGLSAEKVSSILFVVTSLVVGGVVSLCGPISSVGIMAPHICRLILGYDHRLLVPGAFLLGGSLVLICDTLARTIIAPYEIPVGVITALLEGPFFLWLLMLKRRRS